MASRSQLPGLDAAEREQARGSPAPTHARLMKAVLSREAFSDPEWLFERKLDGIRCLSIRDGGTPRMLSRNDLDLAARYPEIRDALAEQSRQRFAVDGETVAFDRGQTSFARLAQRGHRRVAVFYYVFDVLWLDGFNVRTLSLRARKRLLRDTLSTGGRLRLSTHRNSAGEAMFDHACRQGWEGVVAKRADGPYRQTRSRDSGCGPCAGRPPRSQRGTWSANRASPGSPPQLVAQVAFTEWTTAGRLRHPRYLGLREDKAAEQVVREA
jgi:bifunctional non-homologous end joining protein LigD